MDAMNKSIHHLAVETDRFVIKDSNLFEFTINIFF